MTSSTTPLCVITGAKGWLGRCIAAHFRQNGWRVREFTRTPPPDAVQRKEAFAFHLAESVDPEAFAGASALVHCAYDFTVRSWTDIHARNVRGSKSLFEGARQAGVRRMVCISSMSAFPGCKSLYGRAKLAIEDLSASFGAFVLRPGLIWGDHPGGMFGNLVQQARKGGILPLLTGGHQLLYLIHQEDVSRLVLRYCNAEFPALNEPVTAAHDEPWNLKDILLEIARGEGTRIQFVPVPGQFVWAALKAAEAFGFNLNFRSDSVVSLLNQNPAPSFVAARQIGFFPGPFQLGSAPKI
jgi:nucleoside-diphosphate-sugar epimerase